MCRFGANPLDRNFCYFRRLCTPPLRKLTAGFCDYGLPRDEVVPPPDEHLVRCSEFGVLTRKTEIVAQPSATQVLYRKGISQ